MYDERVILGGLDCSVAAPVVPIFAGALDRQGVVVRANTLFDDGIGVGVGELQIGRPNDIAKKHR